MAIKGEKMPLMLKHNKITAVSDIFVNYATFGLLFVSIKVSDCISFSNLCIIWIRPAYAECLPHLQGFTPLYKPRLGHIKSQSSCKQDDWKLSLPQSKELVISTISI